MNEFQTNQTLRMVQPAPVVENFRHERLGELVAVVVGRRDRSVRYGLISHLRSDGRRTWIGFPIGEFQRVGNAPRLLLNVSSDIFESVPGVDLGDLPSGEGLKQDADPQVLELLGENVRSSPAQAR